MPCEAPPPPDHDSGARRKADSANDKADKALERAEEALEKLEHYEGVAGEATRLLCGLCELLEDRGVEHWMNEVDGLAEWWEEHKELDRQADRRT